MGLVGTLVFSVIIAAIGLADVPRTWIIAGTAVLSVASLCIGHALMPSTIPATKVKALGGAVAALLVYIVGTLGYAQFWDPAISKQQPVAFILRNASETQCLRPSAEPGGPRTLDIVL